MAQNDKLIAGLQLIVTHLSRQSLGEAQLELIDRIGAQNRLVKQL